MKQIIAIILFFIYMFLLVTMSPLGFLVGKTAC